MANFKINSRPIRAEEQAVIEYMLRLISDGSNYKIPSMIEPLDDGGMGSIQLTRNGKHSGDLIQLQYLDSDKQVVLITLTKKEFNELYDMDIWKVDFKPLIKFPKPEELFPVK
jgi:hypothetical protein